MTKKTYRLTERKTGETWEWDKAESGDLGVHTNGILTNATVMHSEVAKVFQELEENNVPKRVNRFYRYEIIKTLAPKKRHTKAEKLDRTIEKGHRMEDAVVAGYRHWKESQGLPNKYMHDLYISIMVEMKNQGLRISLAPGIEANHAEVIDRICYDAEARANARRIEEMNRTPVLAKKGVEQHRKSIEITKCDICGYEGLDKLPIDHYDHDGGRAVEGFDQKQWLSVKCECGYEWSLWKLEDAQKRFAKTLKAMEG